MSDETLNVISDRQLIKIHSQWAYQYERPGNQ